MDALRSILLSCFLAALIKYAYCTSNSIAADLGQGISVVSYQTDTNQSVTVKIPRGPSQGGGVTYIRWGRVCCKSPAEIVYVGYTAGTHWAQTGSASNRICLPTEPEYFSDTPAPTNVAHAYVGEYETGKGNKIFGKDLQDFNVPCTVCFAPRKTAVFMIPAKITCPSSWTREYYGYLMTNKMGHQSNQYYECVDVDALGIDESSGNEGGTSFYFTEARCNNHGLPCGPYVNSRALTCAVCTK